MGRRPRDDPATRGVHQLQGVLIERRSRHDPGCSVVRRTAVRTASTTLSRSARLLRFRRVAGISVTVPVATSTTIDVATLPSFVSQRTVIGSKRSVLQKPTPKQPAAPACVFCDETALDERGAHAGAIVFADQFLEIFPEIFLEIFPEITLIA